MSSSSNETSLVPVETVGSYVPSDGQTQYELLDGQRVWAYGHSRRGVTMWEHHNDVDVLGPDFEEYETTSERFVFDWDDTCKDTGKYWIQAHREVLLDFDFSEAETSDDEILKLFGNIHVGDTLGIERFAKDGKSYDDTDIWNFIKDRARDLLKLNPMDPLLIQALLFTKSCGARMAVWSSSPRQLILEAIDANSLSDVFDIVVSVDDVDADKHKPHKQGFLMAVEAMDRARGYLQPDQDYSGDTPLTMNGVWMFGDSPNDILAGKNCGASTAWIEHPLQGNNAFEKREKTMANLQASIGGVAVGSESVDAALYDLIPTITIRTFDPEELGYARNISITQLPKEEVRLATTVNINFVKFLIDIELRARLYRSEHVREALELQGISNQHNKGLAAVFYGQAVTSPKRIAPRTVKLCSTPEQARASLDNIIAKRSEEAIL